MRSLAVILIAAQALGCQRSPQDSGAASRAPVHALSSHAAPASSDSPTPADLRLAASASSFREPSDIVLVFTNSGSRPVYLQPLYPRATALLERYNDILHTWESQSRPVYCATGMLTLG